MYILRCICNYCSNVLNQSITSRHFDQLTALDNTNVKIENGDEIVIKTYCCSVCADQDHIRNGEKK